MRTQIHKSLPLLALLLSAPTWAHENAGDCSATVANQPAFERARAELKVKPKAANTRIQFADQLVEAGCYDEAVHVLEDGAKLEPEDRNLQTRLRTAKSFIGERDYLAKQANAGASTNNAEFLRAELRCRQFGDVQSCEQAVVMKPTDATLWIARGDALLKEKRPSEALFAFNRAKQVSSTSSQSEVDLTSRISSARTLLALESPPSIAEPKSKPTLVAAVAPVAPKRMYSNIEPAGRSN